MGSRRVSVCAQVLANPQMCKTRILRGGKLGVTGWFTRVYPPPQFSSFLHVYFLEQQVAPRVFAIVATREETRQVSEAGCKKPPLICLAQALS